jgi:hypothetical protein
MAPTSTYLNLKSILDLTLSRVDKDLNCIKGGGACHLREKVLAEAAKTCVVDLGLDILSLYLPLAGLLWSLIIVRTRNILERACVLSF